MSVLRSPLRAVRSPIATILMGRTHVLALMDTKATVTIVLVRPVFSYRIRLLTTLTVISDIDECSLVTSPCGPNALCNNTAGSFECTCQPGYTGDALTGCTGTSTELQQFLVD